MYTVVEAPAATSKLGSNLLPTGEFSFLVWAPNASSVTLRLAPDAATPATDLKLEAGPNQGYWSAKISGAKPGHTYLFRIQNNGQGFDNPGVRLDKTDPCTLQATGSQPGLAGVLVDPGSYRFQSTFQTPRFENFILYQAHIGSFTGRSDNLPTVHDGSGWTAGFANVKSKLNYIRSMNFNAIQFLPAGEYRGSEGEAYNPSNYFAPETLYGTPDELRELVDACHASGLAVFFDVVYNHMDGGDNLWQFDGNCGHRTDVGNPASGGGIYFSNIETAGFGRRPDHDSPDVQRFFIANASMWFDQYRIDGLRFDSVANFSRDGLFAILQPLLKAYPDKFLYAEDSDPNYAIGNLGFPAMWEMNSPTSFYWAVSTGDLGQLRSFLDTEGYPAPFAAIRYPLGSHDQIFDEWDGPDANHGQWNKFDPNSGMPENRYFVERIGGAVNGRSNWYARAKARLGWALAVAAPGTPMLFMGSEAHHYGYWNAATDPFGDHRFDWSIAGDPTGWAMRNLVTDANQVRWSNDCLRTGPGFSIAHQDDLNHVLAFLRWNNAGNVVLTVVNVSDNQWENATYGVTAGAPGESWTEIFNSQAPQYGGWQDSGNYGANPQVQGDGRFYVRLPKWSVLMFRKN